MNELQVAMIGAGAAAVAAVWGYNKWQENQQKRLAEKVFKGGQADALLGDRHAPGTEPGGMTPAFDDKRREPVLPGAEDEQQQVTDSGELPPLPEEYADEIADCVVRIDFAEPVSAPGIWAAQSRWAGQISKPLHWLGLDEQGRKWQVLSGTDTAKYKVVCAALQLANRQGAVSDAELSVFLDGIWDLAGQCSGVTGIPKRDDVLMTARNIDEFCAGVDLQLGVKIVGANDPISGSRLKELAEAAGLSLHEDGTFHYIDVNGLTRFTLANIGAERFELASLESLATHGVALSMDVPRVPDGPTAFDALMSVAKPLTDALGGYLVDSQGNALTAEMIASIRAKIVQIQGLMARQQVVAGSTRALRLFS